MAEQQKPTSRLAYSGDLALVIDRLCAAYGVGTPTGYSVVEVGYEDCNVILATDQGKYLAKMFAKTRSAEDIARYATTMQRVVESGINHPELLAISSGEVTYTDSGITLVLMRFVEGKTFFELDRVPDADERKAILEQAALVNGLDYKPAHLFDSWAIPNIRSMFKKVRHLIQPDDLVLVEKTLVQYEAIPVDDLPHCFVHGDFTKTNVLKADDGKICILDFSVANWYPRIQELAVIAANLLHDPSNNITLQERCKQIAEEYSQYNPLTAVERRHLPVYALAGVAMEFMGAHQEKYINGNNTDETDYWLNLGREGLRRGLHKT